MRYYTRRSTANGLVPMTEKEFVSGVLGCGLLVYMSVVWIGELFAIVSSRDLLAEACTPAELESPFVQTVRDIDGTGNDHPYLSDYARLDGLSHKMFEPPKVAGELRLSADRNPDLLAVLCTRINHLFLYCRCQVGQVPPGSMLDRAPAEPTVCLSGLLLEEEAIYPEEGLHRKQSPANVLGPRGSPAICRSLCALA